MNELSITENLIAEYRSNYNKQVKEYNRYIRKFPTRFFLNILGYEVRGVMGLSKLSEECKNCPFVSRCKNKRMEALAYMSWMSG